MAVSKNFTAGSIVLEDLRLNIAVNNGDSQSNVREDFGTFPLELAIKVCDFSRDLSDEDVRLIKAELSKSDVTDDRSMAWLVNSVMKHGVKTQLEGYISEDAFVVVEGNRRFTASAIAKRVFNSECPKALPARKIEKSELNPQAILMRQFLADKGKLARNPVETASLLFEMIKIWGSIEAVSEVTGYPVLKIENIISVLNLTAEAQEVVNAGFMKETPVLQIISKAESQVSNPIEAVKVASATIVEAAQEAKANGKSKASGAKALRDMDSKGSSSKKVDNNDPDFHPMNIAQKLQMHDWNDLSEADMKKIRKLLVEAALLAGVEI